MRRLPALLGGGLYGKARQFARDDAFDIALDQAQLAVGLAGEGDPPSEKIDPGLTGPAVIELAGTGELPLGRQIELERQRHFGRAGAGLTLEDPRDIARRQRADDGQGDSQRFAAP